MPSINVTPPEEDSGTCPASDPTCSSGAESKPPAGEQEPTEQPPVGEQPQQQSTGEQPQQQSDGTEGIRTTPIPMSGGSTAMQQPREGAESRQAAAGGAPQASRPAPGTGPGMRNLVRFLNNPEGAMTNSDSSYLRTMYSTDQADLVVKSAMNSSGFY